MCSIGNDCVLTTSLHLRRELTDKSVLLAANTHAKADAWLSELEVLEQVRKLLVRLLFDMETQLKLLSFSKDLGNLR